jgi:DNA replication protein DnaC
MTKVAKERTIGCKDCYHKGYVVEQRGDYSVAKTCKCALRCTECDGTGSILSKSDKGYTYISTCNVCGAVRKKVKLYNLACIPAKYSHVLQVDAAFEHKGNQTLQNALKYVKEEFVKKYPSNKRGFLLMGGPGRGKTHLAIGTISELILERGVKCMFKDFFHLLSELKEAYSQGTPENAVLFPLIETEVLVIDELGKGKSSEWELNILDQLISKRYNASKTTLATTNYISREYSMKRDNKEEQQILEDRVGERIASRLYEMCEFIYIEGDDHRGESYKKAKKRG